MPRGQHVLVCACLRNVLLTARPYDVGLTLGPCGMRKQVWLVLRNVLPTLLSSGASKTGTINVGAIGKTSCIDRRYTHRTLKMAFVKLASSEIQGACASCGKNITNPPRGHVT